MITSFNLNLEGNKNMNIIGELYYGNINPVAKKFDQKSEYGDLLKTMVDNEKKLTDYIRALPNSQEQQELFSQMIDTQIELAHFSQSESFIDGFRLGAQLMLDTFILPQQS